MPQIIERKIRAPKPKEKSHKVFLCPYIGKRQVNATTAQELLGALRRIEARGRHETAHRVRALPGQVLRFAVESILILDARRAGRLKAHSVPKEFLLRRIQIQEGARSNCCGKLRFERSKS